MNSGIRINGNFYKGGFFQIHSNRKRFSEIPQGEELFRFLGKWFSTRDQFVLKTSGTTGKPKNIFFPRKAFELSAGRTCNFFNLNRRSNLLLALPLDFVAGKMMVVRAIYCAGNLVSIRPSATPKLPPGQKINFAAFTPHMLVYLLRAQTERKLLQNIENVITGGSPVLPQLAGETAKLANNIYETYGMTETLTHIALKKISDGAPEEFFTVLDGIQIETDERKRLRIRVPGITDGFITTNDVVEKTSHNRFKWISRTDHVINTGGIKVYPEEVEARITLPFAVSSVADDNLGEMLVAVIDGAFPGKTVDGLIEKLHKIEKVKRPKLVICVDQIPKTESGKIKRPQLKQMLTEPGYPRFTV